MALPSSSVVFAAISPLGFLPVTEKLTRNNHPMWKTQVMCGIAIRNNTLSEVFVFHKALSTPEVAKPNSSVEPTPRENSKQSTFYRRNPIMSTSLHHLIHFLQHRVLEIIYYNTRVQSAIMKQRNLIIIERKRYMDPSVPTRRILHTKANSSSYTCNRVKYRMYSQDLPDS